MSSSNPAFNDNVFNKIARSQTQAYEPATIQGAVNKTFFLLTLVTITSMLAWVYADFIMPFFFPIVIVSVLVQLGMTIYIVRNPESSKNLSILYALIEGVVLGPLTLYFETSFPGIAVQAIMGTIGVILSMLFLYKFKIIRVTENFKLIVASATMGIAFIYLINIVMGFFGTQMSFIHEGGFWGIGFSLFVVGLAAFNLAVDFDFIEKCEERKAPRYMEWYGAFGLMVTIIWLYIEMLRLLAKSKK